MEQPTPEKLPSTRPTSPALAQALRAFLVSLSTVAKDEKPNSQKMKGLGAEWKSFKALVDQQQPQHPRGWLASNLYCTPQWKLFNAVRGRTAAAKKRRAERDKKRQPEIREKRTKRASQRALDKAVRLLMSITDDHKRPREKVLAALIKNFGFDWAERDLETAQEALGTAVRSEKGLEKARSAFVTAAEAFTAAGGELHREHPPLFHVTWWEAQYRYAALVEALKAGNERREAATRAALREAVERLQRLGASTSLEKTFTNAEREAGVLPSESMQAHAYPKPAEAYSLEEQILAQQASEPPEEGDYDNDVPEENDEPDDTERMPGEHDE